MKIVIVPDAHAMPLGSPYDNERFTWLGKFVKDEKPDTVLSIGDWADMPSLAGFDPLGSIQSEGARYVDDVAGSVDALERFQTAAKGWSGRKVITLGNHDVRADRAATKDAKMWGAISVRDLQFQEHGWDVVPFQEHFLMEGITFCHYFVKTNARFPMSHARAILADQHDSAIAGHNHLITEARDTGAGGRKIFAMTVGTFGHPKYGKDGNPKTSWAKTSVPGWDHGVIVLETDGKGYYTEKREVQTRVLAARYGDKHNLRKRR